MSGYVKSGDSVLSRVIINVSWMFNSSLIVRILNLIRGIIFARILFPEDFGIFGLAMVVIGFAQMFSDVGAGISLIYKQHIKDEKFINTAFLLNILVATIMVVVIIVFSPLISDFYNKKELFSVLVVMSFSLWFQVMSSFFNSILRRDLRFKALSVTEIAIAFISLTSAIIFVLNGLGVWAMVFSFLLGNILQVFFLWYLSAWVPKWSYSFTHLKLLLPFSGNYIGQAFVWYGILNMGSILIGKVLGIEALGVYTIAYNYSLLTITLVANPLGNVTFPELAKLINKKEEFWTSYFQFSRLLIGAISPIAIALFVSAPDLFPVLFGEKWNGAILPFQIFLLYGLLRCFFSDPFGATGRFGLSFIYGIVVLILSFFGISFGLKYGIVGAAIAILFVVGFSHLFALVVVSKSPSKLFRGILGALPYVGVSIVAGILASLFRSFLFTAGIDNELILAASSIMMVFLIYFLVFRKDLNRTIVTVLGSKRI